MCGSCLPETFDAVDKNEIAAVLGYISQSIEYIRCAACLPKAPNALYCRMHGLPYPLPNSHRAAKGSEQDARHSGERSKSGGQGKNRKMPARRRDRISTEDSHCTILNSDEEMDAPLIMMKSAARCVGQSSSISTEAEDCKVDLSVKDEADFGGSADHNFVAPLSPAHQGRKRPIEADVSPDSGRPSRRCALIGQDARLARHLQQSGRTELRAKRDQPVIGASNGVDGVSPKQARRTASKGGQALAADAQAGLPEIEAQELAWSCAETPSTPSDRQVGLAAKSVPLVFPSLPDDAGICCAQGLDSAPAAVGQP